MSSGDTILLIQPTSVRLYVSKPQLELPHVLTARSRLDRLSVWTASRGDFSRTSSRGGTSDRTTPWPQTFLLSGRAALRSAKIAHLTRLTRRRIANGVRSYQGHQLILGIIRVHNQSSDLDEAHRNYQTTTRASLKDVVTHCHSRTAHSNKKTFRTHSTIRRVPSGVIASLTWTHLVSSRTTRHSETTIPSSHPPRFIV